MLIQMTADRFGASGTLYTKGTQYDLAADLAFRFIGDGVAFDVGTARESQEGGQLVPVKFNKVTGVMEADGAPVSGAGISTPFTVNSRDGLGRVTSYTEGTTTFTVTYGAFGVDTISGGGKVRTVARNASGQITGVTDA